MPESCQKYFFGVRTMMTSSGDIVYCTAPYVKTAVHSTHRLYIRFTSEGNLVTYYEYPEACFLFEGPQGSLFEYQDGTGNYGHAIAGAGGNDKNRILRMNDSFEVVQQQIMPDRVKTDLGNLYFPFFHSTVVSQNPDASILLGCNADLMYLDSFRTERVVAMMRMESDGNISHVSLGGVGNDSLYSIATNKGMDRKGSDLFFCNGVYDPNSMGIEGPNRFVVTKTDSEANTIWERYCQDGETIFQPFSVSATIEGGCLVTGNCVKYGSSKVSVFVLRIFKDGTLSFPESKIQVRPYICYPNPVHDRLTFHYSPDVKPDRITLYDMQGRVLGVWRSGLENIDLSELPAGNYTLCVILEDGKSYSQKVVKE